MFVNAISTIAALPSVREVVDLLVRTGARYPKSVPPAISQRYATWYQTSTGMPFMGISVTKGFTKEGLKFDLVALPLDTAEQYQAIRQDGESILPEYLGKYPDIVLGEKQTASHLTNCKVATDRLAELPAVMVVSRPGYNYRPYDSIKVGLELYAQDREDPQYSDEYWDVATLSGYIQSGAEHRQEVNEKLQEKARSAAFAAERAEWKKQRAQQLAIREERIAREVLNFRADIEAMEAVRLQWSLDAPSEMEAATKEAKQELDDQFAHQLELISEVNGLADKLQEITEPKSVQDILCKLSFAWGYITLVICAFIGTIVYVVM